MSYSDFPIGADVPPFLHNTDVVKYFKRYAEHFNLLPRVQFDTRIDKVTATDDHATTGNWSVTYANWDREGKSGINKGKREHYM